MKLIFCISLLLLLITPEQKTNATISTKFADARHESLSGADISDGISALNSNPAFTGGSFNHTFKDLASPISLIYWARKILFPQAYFQIQLLTLINLPKTLTSKNLHILELYSLGCWYCQIHNCWLLR